MVLFAQFLLNMIALWLFWRILPVLFCQIYYFFTQTAKFNQMQFDLRMTYFDFFQSFSALKIWKYCEKCHFFVWNTILYREALYLYPVKYLIRNCNLLKISFWHKKKKKLQTELLILRITYYAIIKTPVAILLTPMESSSIAPDALHNIYVCKDFVKNISKKLRFWCNCCIHFRILLNICSENQPFLSLSSLQIVPMILSFYIEFTGRHQTRSGGW